MIYGIYQILWGLALFFVVLNYLPNDLFWPSFIAGGAAGILIVSGVFQIRDNI